MTKIETPRGPSKDGSVIISFARSVGVYGTAGSAMPLCVRRRMSRIYLKAGAPLTLQLEG